MKLEPHPPARPHKDGHAGPGTRAFYHWNPATDALRWGGHCEPILGRPAADMPATLPDWLATVHPDDRPAAAAALARFRADRAPVRLEFRVCRRDGRFHTVAAHAAFVGPADVVGSVARAADRARVWEVPPPSDEASGSGDLNPELTRLFDLSEDLLCIAGLDGHFRRVNPAFTRVLGHPAADLLARPYMEFVHPDDRPGTRAAVDRLARGQTVVQFQNRYRDAGGGYRWLEWTARGVPAEGAIFGVARDVTARVELERKLRDREERERAILDNTTAVIYVKDRDGRYEFVNQRYATLFGVAPAQVVGRTDDEVFPPAFAARFMATDRQVFETGRPFEGEEVAPHPDGPHTYLSVKVPLRDAAGAVVGLAGISTDITDRLRAEEADAELKSARRVQQRLYPAAAPAVPGFDLAGRGRSASPLCGDYFDYIPRADGKLVVAVGDVCGHGLGPALTTVEARAALRLLLAAGGDLPAVLEQLNRHLHCDAGDSLFVSLFLAEIDPAARTVAWAGAGHEGYLLRAGGAEERLESTGPVLGIVDPVGFAPSPAARLAPGDVLVLFTDGLAEAMDPAGELFGVPRLLAAARAHRHEPAAAVVAGLFAAVDAHVGGQRITDDMTAIVLKAE